MADDVRKLQVINLAAISTAPLEGLLTSARESKKRRGSVAGAVATDAPEAWANREFVSLVDRAFGDRVRLKCGPPRRCFGGASRSALCQPALISSSNEMRGIRWAPYRSNRRVIKL